MKGQAASESRVPAELMSDVLWRRVGATSLEHFRLSKIPDTYVLQGIVLSSHEVSPQQVHYAVTCDPGWNTRIVHVTVIEGDHYHRLQLERDESGVWRRDGAILTDFAGVVDIDLQVTPATNTLPIRRLELGVGEQADIDALWVRFPNLDLEVLSQRYTRIAEDRYRYESRGGSFTAELAVDREGVVVTYGDIWQRVRS